jgi:hypothetical protein
MASNQMVPSPHVLHGPDDWIRRYYDFFLQRGNSRPGHVVDGQGGPSVSERELNRLRDFYHGLTDELGRVRQHAEEANKVSEGLMHLCQDHLTILGELEQQNADLRKENRNLKDKINQQLKEDDRCSSLLSA